jgi:4-hydroxy-tetrahydrodipicolinate synthase
MNTEIFEGIWSAAPTPFDEQNKIDKTSVNRLVKHHLRLGVKGVFLAGSCGEGPWLSDAQKSTLVQTTVKAAKGKLGIAVQVTDNSAARILDNIAQAKNDGAEYAVVAAPFFLMHATPKVLWALYEEVLNKSTLPVIFYDRGKHSVVDIPTIVLKKIYEHSAVIAIKDSSSDPSRMKIALAARRKRPEMRLLTGDEFDCVGALRIGYNGLMLGGAAFNGFMAGMIRQAALDNNWAEAEKLQKRMNDLMFKIYGGKKILCWLAGEKYILQKLGIFKNYRNLLGYELTIYCATAIDTIVETEQQILLPLSNR